VLDEFRVGSLLVLGEFTDAPVQFHPLAAAGREFGPQLPVEKWEVVKEAVDRGEVVREDDHGGGDVLYEAVRGVEVYALVVDPGDVRIVLCQAQGEALVALADGQEYLWHRIDDR